MLKYKINPMEMLNAKGISQKVIRDNGYFGQVSIKKFREENTNISAETLNRLCYLLNLQPGDLLEFEETDADRDIQAVSSTNGKRFDPWEEDFTDEPARAFGVFVAAMEWFAAYAKYPKLRKLMFNGYYKPDKDPYKCFTIVFQEFLSIRISRNEKTAPAFALLDDVVGIIGDHEDSDSYGDKGYYMITYIRVQRALAERTGIDGGSYDY